MQPYTMFVLILAVTCGSVLSSGIDPSYTVLGVGGVFSILEQLDPSSQARSSQNIHEHDIVGNHGAPLQQRTIHQLGGIFGLIASKAHSLKHPIHSNSELEKVALEFQRAAKAPKPRDHAIVSGYRREESGNRSTQGGKRFGDKMNLSYDQHRKRNRAEDGGFLDAVSHSKKDTGQYENSKRKEKLHKGGHSESKDKKNSHHSNAASNEGEHANRGVTGHRGGFGLIEDHGLRGFMRGRQRSIGRYGYVPGRSKFGY